MSSIADDEDDDVISSLLDSVLCHILSFLLTKQVVATSVLSKRWRHLWRTVSIINFKGKKSSQLCDEETLIRFNYFVYLVLLSRGSNSIKSFRLKVHYGNLEDLGFPSVFIWINHVVQRSVETLDLFVDTMNEDFPKLPTSILSCRTLVVLKCSGFTVEGFSSCRLPSLKILHLKEFVLRDARDLVLLLDGCPILEDLYTHEYGNIYLELDCEDSLTYQDCESLSLMKLTKAQMPDTFCHFPLKALHNVEELYIEINKVYRSFDEIPTFHNLTRLKLHSINSNWDLLVQVLNHCPILQNVELSQGTTMGFGIEDNVQQNWVDPIVVPRCLSLHLKTCTLWYFEGRQGELQLATYILNNARVLQTMKISCRGTLKKKKRIIFMLKSLSCM